MPWVGCFGTETAPGFCRPVSLWLSGPRSVLGGLRGEGQPEDQAVSLKA